MADKKTIRRSRKAPLVLLPACAACLLLTSALSGCGQKKDPGFAAYQGPGGAKPGAPSMTPGGPGPGITKPAAPVSARGGQRRK